MKEKIDLFKVFMAPTAADEVGKVLNSGYIGQGPKVEEFEKQLKTLFNHDYVATVNAGTCHWCCQYLITIFKTRPC